MVKLALALMGLSEVSPPVFVSTEIRIKPLPNLPCDCLLGVLPHVSSGSYSPVGKVCGRAAKSLHFSGQSTTINIGP